jgi:hypothetical protein
LIFLLFAICYLFFAILNPKLLPAVSGKSLARTAERRSFPEEDQLPPRFILCVPEAGPGGSDNGAVFGLL